MRFIYFGVHVLKNTVYLSWRQTLFGLKPGSKRNPRQSACFWRPSTTLLEAPMSAQQLVHGARLQLNGCIESKHKTRVLTSVSKFQSQLLHLVSARLWAETLYSKNGHKPVSRWLIVRDLDWSKIKHKLRHDYIYIGLSCQIMNDLKNAGLINEDTILDKQQLLLGNLVSPHH